MPQLRSHLGLPALAGVCTFDEACRVGYGVEANVARLKRYHYVLKRTHEILVGRLPGTAIYELKMGFSYHAYLLAENIAGFRRRVGEMREPPLGLDDAPHPALEILFDEIRAADPASPLELMTGIYAVALPALLAALDGHLAETNPLVDHPTVRLLRHLRLDLGDALAWGRASLEKLLAAATPAEREICAAAGTDFRAYLQAAGGLPGHGRDTAANAPPPARKRSLAPFRFNPVPARDARFPDPFNMGTHAEVFIYDEKFPAEPKEFMLLFKRLREIDVPEMIASILAETPGKPWAYYRDLTRQLWDEARHAMMGEVGLEKLGVDWHRMLIRHTFGWELNTLCTPAERHAMLFTIEHNLMPKTGKRYEYEVALAAGNPLLATFQDYDWADEVLHARIGKDWFASEYPSTREAKALGDASFAKVNRRRPDYRALGWTEHKNWWPDFYRHACAVLGRPILPEVAAYAVSEVAPPPPADHDAAAQLSPTQAGLSA